MELLHFKTVGDSKLYFMSNVLPFMENEDALTADTLFHLWLDNPSDYQPDVVVTVEELEDTKQSDAYDLATHN